MVERAAHNGFVVGSNPTEPKYLVKFSIKTYKLSKIENQFKHNHFFFVCNTTTTKNNIETTQKLKKLNLQPYGLYKTLTRRVFLDSIYVNHMFLINGLVMLVIPETTLTSTTLLQLNDIVTVVGVKINSKIYSITQLNSLTKFKYNEDCVNLIQTLRASLKTVKIFNYS